MDGTASGKERLGVNAAAALLTLLLVLAVLAPAGGQTPGFLAASRSTQASKRRSKGLVP